MTREEWQKIAAWMVRIWPRSPHTPAAMNCWYPQLRPWPASVITQAVVRLSSGKAPSGDDIAEEARGFLARAGHEAMWCAQRHPQSTEVHNLGVSLRRWASSLANPDRISRLDEPTIEECFERLAELVPDHFSVGEKAAA